MDGNGFRVCVLEQAIGDPLSLAPFLRKQHVYFALHRLTLLVAHCISAPSFMNKVTETNTTSAGAGQFYFSFKNEM
ncbi:hypothetical protein [Noviherbaspirillum humi]|uniref:hypothetical protein n=1 Tax=Noviherbaspirillum humi TaxID=1688639 RepID=UPI001160267E|nr:hypothetical protein [Noviherbaspirillum humi]